jgi:hypothetical protein
MPRGSANVPAAVRRYERRAAAFTNCARTGAATTLSHLGSVWRPRANWDAMAAAGQALAKTGVHQASAPAGVAAIILPRITAWSGESNEMLGSPAIRRSGKLEIGNGWREANGPCLTAQRGVTFLRIVELIVWYAPDRILWSFRRGSPHLILLEQVIVRRNAQAGAIRRVHIAIGV